MSVDATALHSALMGALTEALVAINGDPIHISDLVPLAGGVSRELWKLDFHADAGALQGDHPFVLQRSMGGKIYEDALDLGDEFQVVKAVFDAGLPVPRPIAFWPDLVGRPTILAQRLEGESIGRKLVKDPALAAARSRLPAQMGETLAALHGIDVEASAIRALLPSPPSGQTPAQSYIATMYRDLDRIGEPHPAIEIALRWLLRHEPPPPSALVLVHGDYRIGNIMVTPQGLNGVIDWEFAHLGDAYEDLVWAMVREWRFGMDQLRFGGIGQPDPFFEAYALRSGFRPDADAIAFWEVMLNTRWAVGTLNQADRHLSGKAFNLEFASLGRKCAEIELEILTLIRSLTKAADKKD